MKNKVDGMPQPVIPNCRANVPIYLHLKKVENYSCKYMQSAITEEVKSLAIGRIQRNMENVQGEDSFY